MFSGHTRRYDSYLWPLIYSGKEGEEEEEFCQYQFSRRITFVSVRNLTTVCQQLLLNYLDQQTVSSKITEILDLTWNCPFKTLSYTILELSETRREYQNCLILDSKRLRQYSYCKNLYIKTIKNMIFFHMFKERWTC